MICLQLAMPPISCCVPEIAQKAETAQEGESSGQIQQHRKGNHCNLSAPYTDRKQREKSLYPKCLMACQNVSWLMACLVLYVETHNILVCTNVTAGSCGIRAVLARTQLVTAHNKVTHKHPHCVFSKICQSNHCFGLSVPLLDVIKRRLFSTSN